MEAKPIVIESLLSALTAKPRPIWTDDQRRKSWRRMQAHSVDVAERLYHAGATDESRCVVLALDGGACPRCTMPLEEVRVDNPYALGVRHRFACRCYPAEREILEDGAFVGGADLDRRMWVRCDAWPGGERCEEFFLMEREARPTMFRAGGEPRYHKYYCERHKGGVVKRSGHKARLEGD